MWPKITKRKSEYSGRNEANKKLQVGPRQMWNIWTRFIVAVGHELFASFGVEWQPGRSNRQMGARERRQAFSLLLPRRADFVLDHFPFAKISLYTGRDEFVNRRPLPVMSAAVHHKWSTRQRVEMNEATAAEIWSTSTVQCHRSSIEKMFSHSAENACPAACRP